MLQPLHPWHSLRGGWVGPGVSLDILEKSKLLDPAGNQTADCPACIQTVHMENKLQTGVHSSAVIDIGRS